MAPAFRSRTAAEQLDALLAGEPARGVPDEVAALVPLARALEAVPTVEPRPEFSRALREQLMLEARTALAPTGPAHRSAPPARRRARDRRVAALVGGLALVGASGSVAMAAQSALPGEALYPVKRGVESVRSVLPVDGATRGGWLLADAEARLDEAAGLASRGSEDDLARIGPTLESFTGSAQQGADAVLADHLDTGDEESVVRLRRFTARSLLTLERLEPAIPSDARDELVAAAAALERIDERAGQACPECTAGSLPPITSLVSAPDPPADAGDLPDADGAGPGTGAAAPSPGGVVPDVDPDSLPPGSVSPDGTADGPTRALDPVRQLADELVQGPDADGPDSGDGDLGGVLRTTQRGLERLVGDTSSGTGDLTDPVTDPLQDLTDDLSDGLEQP